jgi:ABC-2 type transport system permease protein
MEQVDGAIPSQIPVLQSILIVWPQITAIIALTVLCFVFSYYLFMKREIR